MTFTGIVRVVLCLGLSLVFLMAGSVKLSPQIHEETHQQISHEFATKYADIWLMSELGFTHEEFRLAVGVFEVAMAVLLWLLPRFSGVCLMGVMGGAIYSHLAANDPNEKVALPAALFTLLFIFVILSGPKKSSGKKKKSA